MEELVAIAKIAKPRGLRGEVVADILTDFPERFDGLKNVVGVSANGTRTDLKIEDSWLQKDRVVLRFAGITSVEAAETLRSVEICIPESAAAELDEGEFFDWQLAGCEVETTEGQRVGIVREIMRTGGTELLVVENGAQEYLIPFAEAICPEVDIEKKRIVVD
ncbi:MAG TPA: ribosome maturation factor RimM, partial [Pyrinomonadaceae bacterium]|nr:ribosome maturation factor RimM [Pyrinomonadaceae bacterium]